MGAKNDPNLLKPLVLSGSAVERDHAVKDQNDAVQAVEGIWLEKAAAQNVEISACEATFFTTLRSRMSGKK